MLVTFAEYTKTVLWNSTRAIICTLRFKLKIYSHNEIVWCNVLFRFSFRFAHHCAECEFDVCPDCLHPFPSPFHVHPLYKANSQDVCSLFSDHFWKCDNCGSLQSNVADNKPWHCPTCKYNLCHSCIKINRSVKTLWKEYGIIHAPSDGRWAPDST